MDIKLTPKQEQLFFTTANEVFWGGAASGGKTFGNKVISIAIASQVPGAQIAIMRNTSKNLRKNYFMGSMSIPELLADPIKRGEVKINYTDMVVSFTNGSAIHFMHAEHIETAIENLQGLEFAIIIFDEAALIPKEIISHAKSRLRLGSLKIENPFWKERLPRLQLTSNPGGISHKYLKDNYIDPAPPMEMFLNEHGKKIIFIPAFAKDNPHVDHISYDKELRSMGDPLKYKQLAEGDWDAGGAAFFSDAFKRDKNVIPDFEVPADWRLTRCYDPGFSSPFGYAVLAKVKGQNSVKMKDGSERYFPNDSIIVYREWYGTDGKNDNSGLRWDHETVAEAIRVKEIDWGIRDRIRAGRADNTLWNAETNWAEVYEARGITFLPADKKKGSRMYGALKMRRMMFAAHQIPLETPALFFVDKCVYSISTIPSLPTDPDNPDDIVTDGVPDHLYDAIRYEIATETGEIRVVRTSGL